MQRSSEILAEASRGKHLFALRAQVRLLVDLGIDDGAFVESAARNLADQVIEQASEGKGSRGASVGRAVVRRDPIPIGEGTEPLRGSGSTSEGFTPSRRRLRRNTPELDASLPFDADGSGWDAGTILRRLGQYDRNDLTDSDHVRCGQAAMLASRVLSGPAATLRFLDSAASHLERTNPNRTPRQDAAIAVLRQVCQRIEGRTSSFGDLSWAQEALHAIMREVDTRGTDPEELLATFTLGTDDVAVQPREVYCGTPEELQTEIQESLGSHHQLLLQVVHVALNAAFHDRGVEPRRDRSWGVQANLPRADGTTRSLNFPMESIDEGRRAPVSSLSLGVRDRISSRHQMLVFRDPADGQPKIYEPELTRRGDHVLSTDSRTLRRMQQHLDQPDMGIWTYFLVAGVVDVRDRAARASEDEEVRARQAEAEQARVESEARALEEAERDRAEETPRRRHEALRRRYGGGDASETGRRGTGRRGGLSITNPGPAPSFRPPTSLPDDTGLPIS